MAVDMYEREVPQKGEKTEGNVVLATNPSQQKAQLLELPDDVGSTYPATLRLMPPDYTEGDMFLTIHTPGDHSMDVVLEIETWGIVTDDIKANTTAPIGSYPHWYDTVSGMVTNRYRENLQPTVICYNSGIELTDMPITDTINYLYLGSNLGYLFEKAIQRDEKFVAGKNSNVNISKNLRPEYPLIYDPLLCVEEDPYENGHSTNAVTDNGKHSWTANLFLEAAAVTALDEYCQFHPAQEPSVSISVPPHMEIARGEKVSFAHLIKEHPHLKPQKIRAEFERRRERHRRHLLNKTSAIHRMGTTYPTRRQPDREKVIKKKDKPSISKTALHSLPPTSHPDADDKVIPETAPIVDYHEGKPNISFETRERYLPSDVAESGPIEFVDLAEESLPLSRDAFTLLDFTRRCENISFSKKYDFYASVTIVYAGSVFIDCHVRTKWQSTTPVIQIYREAEYPSELIEVIKEYILENCPIPLYEIHKEGKEDVDPYSEAPLAN